MNTFTNLNLFPSPFNIQALQPLLNLPLFPSFNNHSLNYSNLPTTVGALETQTTLKTTKKIKTEIITHNKQSHQEKDDDKAQLLNNVKLEEQDQNITSLKQETVFRSNSTSDSLSEMGIQELLKLEEISDSILDSNAIDQKIINERKSYAKFFSETRKNMLQNWQKKMEFLKMLEELNQPENAMLWPVLDQINPVLAGVMNRKSKMDKNTLTVLKRSLRLMKSGPNFRSVNKNKKVEKEENKKNIEDVFKPAPVNGKRALKESEKPSKNYSAKKVTEANGKNNVTQNLEQIMEFIIKGDEF